MLGTVYKFRMDNLDKVNNMRISVHSTVYKKKNHMDQSHLIKPAGRNLKPSHMPQAAKEKF